MNHQQKTEPARTDRVHHNRPRSVLDGDIRRHLVRLAIPSVGGMFAITIFNLTDTFFVSRLGTDPLAAMGFTFPVVLIIGAFSQGISMGAGSILARAMGRGDHHKMNRVATDGILLSVLAVGIIALIGLGTMDRLFTLLGASEQVLPLVKAYMTVWYSGVAVVVMPPVSDSCMRAMGDMVRPLLVMLVCAVSNVILDPILIFGYFGLPAMGIAGAATATVISRGFGMVLTLSFVHFHYGLIDFRYKSVRELFDSWRGILGIGLPGALVRLLPQVVRSVVTRAAAVVAGTAGVAALAAGTRIESFATIISMAVGVAMIPIIGQNYGAGRFERVAATRRMTARIAVGYGLLLFLLALAFSRPVVKIFSDDPEVIRLASLYLRIVLIGSIGLNLYNWLSEGLNAIGKPLWSLGINLIGTLCIIVPAIFGGVRLDGFTGMLIGLIAGQIVVGCGAYLVASKVMEK